MLTVENLIKTFRSGDHDVHAVNGISLKVDEGIFASIVGKSGSGKSTLLSMLGALDRPTSGSVKVDSEDIAQLSSKQLTLYRRQKIGFVFQAYNLVPNLTAIENVTLPMEFAGVSAADQLSRAKHLLKEVGLDENKQHRLPGRLSGGEQQRVAIARALANKPRVILADEPTGNLDSQTSKMIIELLRNLTRSEKTTIVIVTHDLAIAKQADVHFEISDGKLVKS